MSDACAQYSLLKPRLYSAEVCLPGSSCGLSGGQCRCGYVFYPWQSYGCEQCGADGEALSPLSLSGRGSLISSAKVHRHQGDRRPVPFTMAAVRLEEGPVVRTLICETASEKSSDNPLPVGAEVQAILAPVVNSQYQTVNNDQGEVLLDLRFELREAFLQRELP